MSTRGSSGTIQEASGWKRPWVSGDLFDRKGFRCIDFKVLATGPMTTVGATRFGSEGKVPNPRKAVQENDDSAVQADVRS